jgi:dienelactone hydrolase
VKSFVVGGHRRGDSLTRATATAHTLSEQDEPSHERAEAPDGADDDEPIHPLIIVPDNDRFRLICFSGETGRVRRIEIGSPEGVRWIPPRHTGVGVLVIAGSSGRIDEARARVLAEAGAVEESVRWFGGPGQPGGPWDVPLETFLHRIDDLGRECDRVWMMGTSFGSEAALLCGALSSRVEGVVAFAPSDVVWAGYDDHRETSHWSLGGRPLPCTPFDWEGYVAETPARFRSLYERSLRTHAARAAEAIIPVERIAQLILVAGGDDQVWPSVDNADRIRSRRSRHGLRTTIVTTPESGHRTILPGEPLLMGGISMARGGSEAADMRLGRLAWTAIQEAVMAER